MCVAFPMFRLDNSLDEAHSTRIKGVSILFGATYSSVKKATSPAQSIQFVKNRLNPSLDWSARRTMFLGYGTPFDQTSFLYVFCHEQFQMPHIECCLMVLWAGLPVDSLVDSRWTVNGQSVMARVSCLFEHWSQQWSKTWSNTWNNSEAESEATS